MDDNEEDEEGEEKEVVVWNRESRTHDSWGEEKADFHAAGDQVKMILKQVS